MPSIRMYPPRSMPPTNGDRVRCCRAKTFCRESAMSVEVLHPGARVKVL